MGDCGGRGAGLFSQCTDPRMTNFPCLRCRRVRHGGLIRYLKKKKVYLRDGDKALLVKQCCFRFESYLAGKKFYKDMQRLFEQETGIDVNVKSLLYDRVTERRREAANDLGMSGAPPHFWRF